MLTVWNPWALVNGTLYTLGLDATEMSILSASLAVMLAVDIIKYKKGQKLYEFLGGQCIWFRWLALILLFLATIIFGMYGAGVELTPFIYFNF